MPGKITRLYSGFFECEDCGARWELELVSELTCPDCSGLLVELQGLKGAPRQEQGGASPQPAPKKRAPGPGRRSGGDKGDR